VNNIINFFNINNIFFTFHGYQMSYLEFMGTLLNLWSVWLVTKNNILTWPVGNIAVILFGILFYHERYMGFISHEVEALSRDRHYDMYFLTDVDIPFVQDGTRDGQHIRQNMHRKFEDELKKKNKPYKVLSGSHETRVKIAIYTCDKILKEVKVF